MTETQKAGDISIRGNGAYLPTLDGWRAIAILLVIFFHAADSIGVFIGPATGFDHKSLRDVGLFGVQIFFGLSGFLITSRLIADEGRRGAISLRSFYIRRAFRILPASIAVLMAVGVLSLTGYIDVTFGRWISTLLFFANYTSATGTWYLGHYWSLAVEEHFYFVWPLAFALIRPSTWRLKFVAVAGLSVALWRAVDFKFHVTGASSSVFWGRSDIQADTILWGVFIALLYNDARWKGRIEQFLRYPATMPCLGMLLILMLLFDLGGWKTHFAILTIKALIVPLMILGTLLNVDSKFSTILESAPLRLIGRLSYSLYLWQQLFLVFNESASSNLSPLQNFPLNILCAFAAASLSMVFIEKPFIRIGHKIAARI